jgi:RimJ/RimL family protein N-acetyltransferase
MVRSPPSARSAFLRDLRCIYGKHGLKGTMQRMARSLVPALYSRVEDLVLMKTLDGVLGRRPSDDVRVEALAVHHSGALADLNRERCLTRKDRRFADRLAKGYRGFLIYSRGEVAGYLWWIDKRIDAAHPEVVHLGIELGDRDVYTFDYYLAEGHRGGGNSLAAFQQIECVLKDLGYRRIWGYVLNDNRPARWIYDVLGYEVFGQVTAHSVLFWRVPAPDVLLDRAAARLRALVAGRSRPR